MSDSAKSNSASRAAIAGQLTRSLDERMSRDPDRIVLPGQAAVFDLLKTLLDLLLPFRQGGDHSPLEGSSLESHLLSIEARLMGETQLAFQYACDVGDCPDACDCAAKAAEATHTFIEGLPAINDLLSADIVAAYEGDPAAKSTMEVEMSYPCLIAIAVHRVAHRLYQSGVPLIPRMMNEWAHSQTGIDIHPGAQIGKGFFIDHGTGVVIGETCVIGTRVKLYQGVTLGALSFEKDEQGRLVKGVKRHPNVEDCVTIYAGATILGGETLIGAGSEIGGNVWLTHSVPPNSKVYNAQPAPNILERPGSPGDTPCSGGES